MDPDFVENEEKYKAIKKGNLGICESSDAQNWPRLSFSDCFQDSGYILIGWYYLCRIFLHISNSKLSTELYKDG